MRGGAAELNASTCEFRARDARGLATKRRAVIRVCVPIDVATVAVTANSAFALVTPMRVEELLVLAVREALGARAPIDKQKRSIRSALDGLRAGKFDVNVDGRTYGPDDVVVCAGTASLRFFSTETRSRILR